VKAALLVLWSSAAAAGDAPSDALAQSRRSLQLMRDQLRAVEHGLEEASSLHDPRAYECLKSGQLALAHYVESAEEWTVLLEQAIPDGDAELVTRLQGRVADAERSVQRRTLELSNCKLTIEPAPPTPNRTWFACSDAPAISTNPAWRGCERVRGSAVTFGLEGLLLAVPIVAVGVASTRNVTAQDYGELMLGSLAGGAIGGIAMLALSGTFALALGQEKNFGRNGAIVGALTGVAAGAGAMVGMWLERPQSRGVAAVSASIAYGIIGGLSALLFAVLDHFSVSAGDVPGTLAVSTYGFAPALMAISAIVTLPAAWAATMRR
jgi:hypothetical protein